MAELPRVKIIVFPCSVRFDQKFDCLMHEGEFGVEIPPVGISRCSRGGTNSQIFNPCVRKPMAALSILIETVSRKSLNVASDFKDHSEA